MALVALLIGVVIAVEGVLGLAAPNPFVKAVRSFQEPPGIYLAAVVRFIFGAVLVGAARSSRAPSVLRFFGLLMMVGGLLTPFVGARAGQVILGWWSDGGPGLVRTWAAAALGLGVYIVYAFAPRRRAA